MLIEAVKRAGLDGFMSVCSATWTKVPLVLPKVLEGGVSLREAVLPGQLSLQNDWPLLWDPTAALFPLRRAILDRAV